MHQMHGKVFSVGEGEVGDTKNILLPTNFGI